MRTEKLAPIRTTLRDSDHPYLTGAWTPNTRRSRRHRPGGDRRRDPADIDGVYVRNTENPVHQPLGRYHPFDGDGMIHADPLPRTARRDYRNRFVRTRGFEAEQEAGGRCGPGSSSRPGSRCGRAGARTAA